jgi:hypothetical protein
MRADNDSVESGQTACGEGVEAEPGIRDEADEVGTEHRQRETDCAPQDAHADLPPRY